MYRWELDGPVVLQVGNLPHEAILALAEFLDAVVFDPWEYGRTADEVKGKPVRMLLLNGGRGLVTFLIYDPDQLVLVTKVQWLDG